MAEQMRILVNNFAIRSFRETADKDYIAARMAYQAQLVQPFLWSSIHCLEKYVKGILLLNRVEAHNGHSVLPGIDKMRLNGKFELDLSADAVQFIGNLEKYGAEYRYYEVSYSTRPFDIVRLDRAVWEIRRYCQPLDYEIVDSKGNKVNSLPLELERIHRAKARHEKGTCIMEGFLEKVIKNRDHPARKALIWNNLFFGPSRRKTINMRSSSESGNSPFFLHPEIIDEVVKYVFIPKKVANSVRAFAKQRAVAQDKVDREANMAAKAEAKQSTVIK